MRIKVLQALYAFRQSDNDNLAQGEKQLITGIDKLYELYIHQLSFLVELARFAEQRIEESKNKLLPTEQDLNPNTRFIENKFIKQISDNKDFRRKEENYKISWSEEIEMVRKFYLIIKGTDEYQDYMNASSCSYGDDKAFVEIIIDKYLSEFSLLQDYYEDRSIYWSDDYYLVLIMLSKTLKSWKEHYDEYWRIPVIFWNDTDQSNEDYDFLKKLFRVCIMKSKEYEEIVKEKTKNWELDRVATMDILIIKMAISEFLNFPTIPVKVTMNEYIEISKYFSTPKSKIFINGILDKLISEFNEAEKIHKIGRGLKE
ncbi:MAG: transcription antitermination factor NusB [Hyphomicrobiales bacterium]